ncbi:MAG TPA: DUF4838 domain-containing protein [bacterium]|nr:DUF4838 domain-containing protein [bacterium]HOL35041.1 DUF4838 domain-containing protein [bacterium]
MKKTAMRAFAIFSLLCLITGTTHLYGNQMSAKVDFKRFFAKKSWPLISNGFEDGSVTVETEIFFKNPPAMKLNSGKSNQKVVSLTFYVIKEQFQLFKGKKVKFTAKIKKITGQATPYIQVRFNKLDEQGKYQFLFGKSQPITIADSEWTDVTFPIEIPNQQDVNAMNFQIYLTKSAVPNVIVVDECEVSEVDSETVSNDKKKQNSAPILFSFPQHDGQPLEIVKEGKPVATIIIAKNPTQVVIYAVKELNDHIKLSTGTTLPVATDEQPISKPAIHIGTTSLSAQLGLSPDILPPDTWVIKRFKNNIIISGGDNNLNIHPVGKDLVPFGTLYATYEFLERVVGVRWFWPGNDGLLVPEHKSIVIHQINWQGTPSYSTRYVFYGVPEGITPEQAWTWWRRMRLGGVDGNPFGMHSFTEWNKKYGKEHPEWFALQFDGKRLNLDDQDEHKNGHLCYTNSEVLNAVIDEVKSAFEKQPYLKYFSIMPGDSNERYFCQCKNCQSLLKANQPASKKYSFAIWSFVNQVAAEVRKSFPDRFIKCCAYDGYRDPPEDAYFQPNVAVTYCVPEELRNPWADDFKKRYVSEITAWNKKVENLYVWDYWLYRWQPGLYGAPAIFPHLLQEIYLLEQGRVRGHVIELCNKDVSGVLHNFWQDWMMDQINVYVGFKLLWNVHQNIDEILDDYYKFFGPAESLIRSFYESMEEAFLDAATKDKDNTWNWETCWHKTYTPEFVNQTMKYLRDAEQITRGKEPYHTRVEKILQGFAAFETASEKFSSPKKESKNKQVTVPYSKQAPIIDGKLNENLWNYACRLGDFVDLFNNPASVQTEFFLVHDNKNFYIGIRSYLKNSEIKRFSASGNTDNPLWEAESCELFLSPDSVQCYQFLIGPDNFFTDIYTQDIKNFKMDGINWNAKDIEYATNMSERFWSAEIKIPFASIQFDPESEWKINACRNYYEPEQKTTATSKLWKIEHSSWLPVFGSFHNISAFGFLKIEKITN